MTLCVILQFENKVVPSAHHREAGWPSLQFPPSHTAQFILKNKDRGEVSILLASPHQRGPLEKNMSVLNDGHINYRLINPAKFNRVIYRGLKQLRARALHPRVACNSLLSLHNLSFRVRGGG